MGHQIDLKKKLTWKCNGNGNVVTCQSIVIDAEWKEEMCESDSAERKCETNPNREPPTTHNQCLPRGKYSLREYPLEWQFIVILSSIQLRIKGNSWE